MAIRVWMYRLRRLSTISTAPLPLVNYSQSHNLSNCNSILHFIQLNRFSSSSNALASSHTASIEIMRGIGLREETIELLFQELAPAVLKDSTAFGKKIHLLKCFGLSSRQIDHTLFTFPGYLQLSFEARLKPLLDEMHNMDFSHAEIREAIHQNPRPVLRLEPGELSRCVSLLDSLRCRHIIKEKILNRGYLQAVVNVKLRIECLHNHGLILRDAFKVLHVEPRAILYDLKDIEEKIKFLLNKMRFCIEHLVECPEYLGVNLEKQIIPRYNVFEHLRSVGGLGDEVWMKHYVKLSRFKFYNMFVKPYPECQKIFNAYISEKRVRPRHPVGMWKLFKPDKFEQSNKDVRNMKQFMKSL